LLKCLNGSGFECQPLESDAAPPGCLLKNVEHDAAGRAVRLYDLVGWGVVDPNPGLFLQGTKPMEIEAGRNGCQKRYNPKSRRETTPVLPETFGDSMKLLHGC